MDNLFHRATTASKKYFTWLSKVVMYNGKSKIRHGWDLTLFVRKYIKKCKYLWSQALFSCMGIRLRGNSSLQYLQWVGSSETAFSTARFLDALFELMSLLQLGHVACSFFNRPSASKWLKQPVHIRCPWIHYNKRKRWHFSYLISLRFIIFIFRHYFTLCKTVLCIWRIFFLSA